MDIGGQIVEYEVLVGPVEIAEQQRLVQVGELVGGDAGQRAVDKADVYKRQLQ